MVNFYLQWLLIIGWFAICTIAIPRLLTTNTSSMRWKDQAGGCGLAIFAMTMCVAIGAVEGAGWQGLLGLGSAGLLLGLFIVALSGL